MFYLCYLNALICYHTILHIRMRFKMARAMVKEGRQRRLTPPQPQLETLPLTKFNNDTNNSNNVTRIVTIIILWTQTWIASLGERMMMMTKRRKGEGLFDYRMI